MDATDRHSELKEQLAAARARVGQLELDQREAAAARQEASIALAEAERTGLSATKRHALEEALTAAKAKADQPWSERLEGTRGAVRDADRALREHAAAHVGVLVEGHEARGEVEAERVNSTTVEFLSAVAAWRSVEADLSATIALVTRPTPADISRPRPETEEAARALAALVASGGERGPTLERRNPPWDRLLGEDEAAETFTGTGDDEPAPAVVA